MKVGKGMERISGYQLCMLGCILPSVIKMTILVPQTFDMSRQHVYLPYIFAALLAVLFLWVAAKVSQRFKDQDWFQILTSRWPVIGRILIVLYLFLFLYLLARDLRILTDFTNIYLLQFTPLLAIALMFIIPVVFMARGGIEIIARMAELFAPVLFILGCTIPLLLAKDANLEFIQPLFDVSWDGVAISTWYVLPFTSEIMLLPFLSQNTTYKFKYGFLGLTGATFIILILTVFELLIIGVHMGSKMMYPTFELVRLIQITDFLDRFELPILSLYYPSSMVKMAISLYLMARGLHILMPKYVSVKTIAAPCGMLGVACSFWFYEHTVDVLQFNIYQPYFVLFFTFFLPLIYFFALRSKKESLS